MSLWDELKERKLVQWSLAYTAVGIAVLEILNAVETPFLIPNAVVRVCMVVIGVGFFVTVVLAWFHGERGHQRVTLPEGVLLLGIGVLGVVAAMLAARPEASERKTVPTAAQGWKPTAGSPERNSIAVLPFANVSGDPKDEYFTDGITEELTNALGELPGLRVASRTSAFQYKGKSADLRQVGSELGVAAVLEGSVQRSGSRLRISARLVDASSGYQIWQQHIDADAADVFAAEDSISRAVAGALQVKLALAREPTENARPTDPLAHQTYLKGKYYAAQSDPDSVRKAQQQFRDAARRDPGFAPAFAALASSFVTLGKMGILPPQAARDSARRLGLHALRMDPTLPDVHVVLAGVADDLTQRANELKKALELNPSNVEAREALAEVMAALGQRDSALAQARMAAALDRSARGRHTWQRIQFMAAPRPPGVDAPPTPEAPGPGFDPRTIPNAAGMHAQFCDGWSSDPTMVRVGNAGRECETARRLGASDPDILATAAIGFARMGRRDEALDALRAAERLAPSNPRNGITTAAVQALLGDMDAAFAALERDDPARLRGMLDDPRLAPLRRDPRFQQLERRVGG